MPSTPAYDLTPLAGLLLVGVLLAIGPVIWVRCRESGAGPFHRMHALRLLTLWLTFDLILFGAFTRLTDSGLGCPDWPGCYGSTSPVGASTSIAAAQAAMPTGPVTQAKAWIEMLHRYLATGVGALIVLMTLAAWRASRLEVGVAGRSAQVKEEPAGEGRRAGDTEQSALPPRPLVAATSIAATAVRPMSPWWATATLVWVCLQGAFGAWTVTWKLFPAIVTLHLAGALVLLALLCVQVVRGQPGWVARELPTALRRALMGVAGLLAVQILLGGWVSTNYAVLACSDFPQCQNRWWPEMNFAQGFELWRHLGVTGTGDPISFEALTAIHYVHRLMAYVVLVALAWLAWQLNRRPQWRQSSRVLAGLVGLQLATGLSNVVLGWPMLAALLHTGGAAALVLALTWIWAQAPSAATQTAPVAVRVATNAPSGAGGTL
ncbi:MAG: COX15/CtaA family protein [Rhodoferax sp.]|jgi:cytochrome c oxidase assembly protein subunit 15|nr:COX15/CtaA family protein [Rhodoferax sp.]